MDGLEVAPEQRKAGKYDSGLEVVPHMEKEVRRDTAGLHYVSGPTSANPGIIEDGSPEPKSPKERKRICGVTSTIFWLLVVGIAIVVIGGAVGGGVGGSMANRKTPAKPSNPDLNATSTTSSTDTTTASTTSSGPVTTGTVGLAGNPCPRSNLTTEAGSDGSIFKLLCAVDWPSGGEAASGNGKVQDLSIETEYTLKACIRQCSDWNKDESNNQKCKGVVYSANLTASFGGGQGGNCFLKSKVGKYFPNADTSVAAGIIG
ncbi:unnamed protein product [Penicillium egyptiacum]|uniref:Apple domain-containing protein n=1 Tax=Penicillium egyptiacum TaxID=1303716 RepID=A0A9W4KRK1_9EURO|nr:unnamed protein product [Penicillium egyptiacum]